MNKKLLTKQEERVMELFWSTSHPLTGKNLIDNAGTYELNATYIYNLLRSLVEKGLLFECGTVKYKTQIVRQFIPQVSKEEFYVQLALANEVDREEFVKEAVKRWMCDSSDKEKIVLCLKQIIAILDTTKNR